MDIVQQDISDNIKSHFQIFNQVDFNRLIQRFNDENPCGESLKHKDIYSRIKEARRSDDPNLPLGVWQHTLKVADWESVTKIALDALNSQSKDLQIAAWLLEAQIHLHGFAGIAPSLLLIKELSENYWDEVYPSIDDGDLEYRINLINWMNEKIQPIIRQLPITQTRADTQFCWSDWEMSIKLAQLAQEDSADSEEYINTQIINQAIIDTPIDFYETIYSSIQESLLIIDELNKVLDEKIAKNTVSLLGIKSLLSQIYDTLSSQTRFRQRKYTNLETNVINMNNKEVITHEKMPLLQEKAILQLSDREMAYQVLGQVFEFLRQDDPHSPVPYLIAKAIEWGKLNTAELYQELFVQGQGQINIFELLGLGKQKN